MAKVKEHSFDITAELDFQELKNAFEQTKKEIVNRFDFKDIPKEVELNEKAKSITIISSNENKVDSIFDVLTSKAMKREIPYKAFKKGEYEKASGGNTKLVVGIIDSISQTDAKKIVKEIKDTRLKVQASIQGETVRVSGKALDDLQQVIAHLKTLEIDSPLNFVNYR